MAVNADKGVDEFKEIYVDGTLYRSVDDDGMFGKESLEIA
jgi:hypothetical protein